MSDKNVTRPPNKRKRKEKKEKRVRQHPEVHSNASNLAEMKQMASLNYYSEMSKLL